MSAAPDLRRAPVRAAINGAELGLYVADLSADDLRQVERAARFRSAAYIKAIARGGFPRGSEHHDLARRVGSWLTMPIGVLEDVAGLVDVRMVRDLRPPFPSARPLELRRALRPHQRAALAALVAHETGVALAPTGSGKTALAYGAIAHHGAPALVVVPTCDLVGQWVEAAEVFLGVRAGALAGGERQIGELVTVATPQGAAAALPELVGRVGVLVVDECHRAAAPTYTRLLRDLPRRVTLGLTATPRADVEWHLALAYLGPVRVVVEREGLEAAGLLVRPRLVQVPTRFKHDYIGPDDWPGLLEALEADDDRRALVADDFAARVRAQGPGLLLAGRVEYARTLAADLRTRGLRAAALFGAMPGRDRAATLAAARAGELDALTSTTLADEGLDVPDLRVLGLAWPSKAEPRLLQRIGRVLRPAPGKGSALVIDYCDGAGPLGHQARVRARTFARHWGAR